MKFVRNDSKVFRFCRAKCHRSFNKKRNPRKVGWTKAFRKTRGKEMSIDSTFEFEKRRNRPEKYDRENMAKTIQAIGRITEIKERRELTFYKNRMKDAKGLQKDQARAEIDKGMELIIPAAAKVAVGSKMANVLESSRARRAAERQEKVK